ncbi:unnamed protein product [Danaus chrysippus]|uniref:(African queen) hypothetical protein n=1 Tax=Danaus chrysippus TaxID=151541 RepID=A0A8J2W8T8_9NEOP|nr:unnamed protein product [Danaus chrysippus]
MCYGSVVTWPCVQCSIASGRLNPLTDGRIPRGLASRTSCGPKGLQVKLDLYKTATTETTKILAPQTTGADSASGGSGGSGMECLQLRSPPGPAFHYLISEQAKSLVALQELQNEVGALLEFRDLVIETFPNLRSKMAPSTPASGTRRDWEPGVRVRRKLAAGGGEPRTKPQPSVQDSGFSTETSCKDAHSAAAARPRPLEDELWALLDVIQRKGVRLRDEAELLRGELDEKHSETAEESFARALSTSDCTDVVRLRSERDALLAHAAHLEAEAEAGAGTTSPVCTPLGRLDRALATPARTPRVTTPDSKKFAAILQESNPVELRRHLLISTVQNQVFSDQLRRASSQRNALLEQLKLVGDENEDLKFRLEEKCIELEGARARVRQLEAQGVSADRSSMRDLQPVMLPDEPGLSETPRQRPSRIPRHKAAAPRPPTGGGTSTSGGPGVSRPPSSHSVRSSRSATSYRSRQPSSGGPAAPGPRKDKSSVPVRRSPSHDPKTLWTESARASLVLEYVARTERLATLAPRLATLAPPLATRAPLPGPTLPRTRPLPADVELDYRLAYTPPQNLALELTRSILYENADSIEIKLKSLNEDSLWNGKPQKYFESLNYDDDSKDFEDDSLA